MPDLRRISPCGCLALVWLPTNACPALLYGPPDRPLAQRSVLRLYRTKDDAFADWDRITENTTLSPQ